MKPIVFYPHYLALYQQVAKSRLRARRMNDTAMADRANALLLHLRHQLRLTAPTDSALL